MLLHRVVIHKVLGLGPHCAHHGNDVARIGVHDGNTGLKLLTLRGVNIQVVRILINAFGNSLDVQIHRAVDLVAAVVHKPLRRLIRDAFGLRKIIRHILDELLNEPVVDLNTVRLLDDAAGIAGGICEVQRLRLGGLIFLFCQVRLAGVGIDNLRHFLQDGLLPLLVQFPGRNGCTVLAGVRPFIFGVV